MEVRWRKPNGLHKRFGYWRALWNIRWQDRRNLCHVLNFKAPLAGLRMLLFLVPAELTVDKCVDGVKVGFQVGDGGFQPVESIIAGAIFDGFGGIADLLQA